MNGNIVLLRRIVQSSLQTTGVLRYNITYIPSLHAYRITLVGSRQGINGQVIGKLLESLSSNGFIVWVRVSKMPIFNVIYIYATPKVSSP